MRLIYIPAAHMGADWWSRLPMNVAYDREAEERQLETDIPDPRPIAGKVGDSVSDSVGYGHESLGKFAL
ncbi:hypothetical protein CCHR01_05453 [Colletotrichum chrysophilum]|uniref:Uncharacterized protein n=1 Tax=Colletotrichum chrysophilum TaxID=1836956 RepID=A0AAD9EHM7_9PEZI|nr:hypothetical protein CCHR01_05453 [Colletotrichum chrysophilum]